MKLDTKFGLTPKKNKEALLKKLLPEIKNINKQKKSEYNSDYASINLPDDKKQIEQIIKFSKQYKKFDALLVVGIGGSNLGTIAVHEAINSKYYNLKSKQKVFFIDTVDSNGVSQVETLIKPLKNIVINVISKSGGTTETIANFEYLKSKFKKANFVITTDKSSKLENFAKENKIPVLNLPKLVGGRYSVLSSVGLFPLALLGINIKKLVKGAKDIQKQCLSSSLNKNIAAESAINLFYHKKQKNVNIVETLLFQNDLESIGKWYRQLMGESIGKQYDLKGKVVFEGMTPSVSLGSTDLHSMAQLYLGGPKDKYLNVVVPSKSKKLKLPKQKDFDKLVPNIQGKTLSKLMDAIVNGITAAFAKQKRAFSKITIDVDEYGLGEFLQFKMFEIIYLAKLLNVNPFDQPNVESYKIETKKELKKK